MQAPNARVAKVVKKEYRMVKQLIELADKYSTRRLWEDIFSEDSKAFIDYYYENKIQDNIIFVIEKDNEIVSMLHLNPYKIAYATHNMNIHYIVAVATKEEYRHQGLMRELLCRSMEFLYRMQEPFTFLMPAKEAIYRPFNFQFIYKQNECTIPYKETDMENNDIPLSWNYATESDIKDLAKFSTKYFREEDYFTVVHDESYFLRLMREQACQQGGIMLIRAADQIVGYFHEASDPVVELREIVLLPEYNKHLTTILKQRAIHFQKDVFCKGYKTDAIKNQTPIIMGRIIHLENMIRLLRAREEVTFLIGLQDSFLKENHGAFYIQANEKGASIKRAQEAPSYFMDIQDLTGVLFGYIPIDTVQEKYQLSCEIMEKWKKLFLISNVFIHEIV